MKILKKILKILGIAVLVLVVGFIGLVFAAGYMFSSDEKEVVSSELVQSTEFKRLHQLVASLDSIQNIAVLPNKNYIVVNGIVINLLQRSYGEEPELGFYQSYYDEGDRTPFASLDSLLASQKIKIDSLQTLAMVGKMEVTGISDVVVQKEWITYRWKTSAMYGEEGVVYSKREIIKDSTRFDLLENLGEGFYHFAVYD
jgi:hypothetical protein